MGDIKQVSSALERARRQAGLSQRELAQRAGTSQPAVARIEQGRANPGIETLRRLAEAAGYRMEVRFVPRPAPDPVIEAYKRDVDRTLLRENLGKTVDQRIQSLVELQEFVRELRRGVTRRPRA